MKVKDIVEKKYFEVINGTGDVEKEVTQPFCCDLLSIAMGKAPAGAAWVTVMGNVNTIAVATLTDVAVVILAEGAAMDEVGLARAKEHGVILLATAEPIFVAANRIAQWLSE